MLLTKLFAMARSGLIMVWGSFSSSLKFLTMLKVRVRLL